VTRAGQSSMACTVNPSAPPLASTFPHRRSLQFSTILNTNLTPASTFTHHNHHSHSTMAPRAGILYVTMHASPSLSPSAFHDWYNNEHGPNRLRLPFITNGFRYRASDLSSSSPASATHPEWMAIYDVTDMSEMNKAAYQRLRGPEVETEREREVRSHVKIDRKLYDFVAERQIEGFEKLEDVQNEGKGNVVIALLMTVKDGKEEELERFYEEEHIELLSKVPGWRRTRRYVTSTEIPGNPEKEHLVLHEYAPENGLGGPEFQAATATEWFKKVFAEAVKTLNRRAYSLFYTLDTPRDISNFNKDYTKEWQAIDGLTKTGPANDGGFVESYITTSDGAHIPYRLEGSADPSAPLILLSNSILVTYSIWDSFISSFLSSPIGKKYRILRYNTRGRTSSFGSSKITIDTLSSDIIALLDALRVPKAAALIGVSLGGATVLNTALKYPSRVSSFIACDTNSLAPSGNRKAWGDRIALAESESLTSQSGEKIVGTKLATATVDRWFVSSPPEKETVRKLIEENSLEGFRNGVEALYEYDLREGMKSAQVKGAFVVGSGDGVLPEGMKKMSEEYAGGKGVFRIVEGVGHLPMVEKPEEFSKVVEEFLGA